MQTLPHNLQAERSVLGAMMKDQEALAIGLDSINRDMFYEPKHQYIFDALASLFNNNTSVDLITIQSEMERSKTLSNIGDIYYVVEIIRNTVTSTSIQQHIDIVKEKHKLRQIIKVTHQAMQKAYDGESSEIISASISSGISETVKSSKGLIRFGDIAEKIVDRAEEKQKQLKSGRESISGITTGIYELDHYLRGMKPKRMYVIAARPSIGKTTIALQVAARAAKEGYKTLFFSFEMDKEELGEKVFSSDCLVSFEDCLSSDRWNKVLNTANEWNKNTNLYIDDSCPDIDRLVTRCHRSHIEKPVDFIVIDYLQLIHLPAAKGMNRNEQLTDISRKIKLLAMELNCVCLPLAQVSRAVEKEDREPRLSDIRDCGAIEQDADGIIFMNPVQPENGEGANEEFVPINFLIKKNRWGRMGDTRALLRGKYSRFESESNHAEAAWRSQKDEEVPF